MSLRFFFFQVMFFFFFRMAIRVSESLCVRFFFCCCCFFFFPSRFFSLVEVLVAGTFSMYARTTKIAFLRKSRWFS